VAINKDEGDEMKIYLAGGAMAWKAQLQGHNLLVSFAERSQLKLLDAGWDVSGWMLDSGAFAAWTLGKPVDLEAYGRFIDKHEAMLDYAVSLDVIPGKPGRLPTHDEAAAAVEQSLANLERLERMLGKGTVMPVFHEGDPAWLLDEYAGRGYDRIALGATASRGKPELLDWLLPIFDRHPDQDFHGLGMTQSRIIGHVPFASVDSTTWLNFVRYGVDSNTYLLKGRTREFLRALGIAALHDIAQCPRGVQATRDGQLRMFPDEAV
jgi:hypothetical protein